MARLDTQIPDTPPPRALHSLMQVQEGGTLGDLYRDASGALFAIGAGGEDVSSWEPQPRPVYLGSCYIEGHKAGHTPHYPLTRLPKGTVVSYTQE